MRLTRKERTLAFACAFWGAGFFLPYSSLTADAVKGDFIFVSTVKSTTYSTSLGKTITVPTVGAVTYS